MKNRYAPLLFVLFALPTARAQYCSPTFLNGCFNWYNQTITVGDIDWTFGSDCTDSDHTAVSTAAIAGEVLSMSVTNGVWTGCAVWADWDQSGSFEESENLFYAYVGGDPGHTYDFNFTVPPGIADGAYRLRVIAPWGSDGFLSTNTNGFGPCGAFQYGSFDDFTIALGDAPNSIVEEDASALVCGPNPTEASVTITSQQQEHLTSVVLVDMHGTTVLRKTPVAPANSVQLYLGALPTGVYVALCRTPSGLRTVRVVKA